MHTPSNKTDHLRRLTITTSSLFEFVIMQTAPTSS
jgi:hypothetical protein